jgi:hypothetical protein
MPVMRYLPSVSWVIGLRMRSCSTVVILRG